MAQYLFSVWHLGAYPTLSEQEMAAMYAAVGAFNDMLRDAGALVFACGLEDAASSVVIDGTGAQVTSRGQPQQRSVHPGTAIAARPPGPAAPSARHA